MRNRSLSILVLVVLAAGPGWALGFYGDVDPIPATVVLDKLQTGEPADQVLEVIGVNSEGSISGSAESGQVKLLFKDLAKIECANHVYHVETKDGKRHQIKFGRLSTHYTSPTFDCVVKNPKTGQAEEQMLDSTQIKSITFGAPAAGAAPAPTGDSSGASGAVDRKDPKAVAAAVLKAIRAADGQALLGLCNATNRRKITPEQLPEIMKELQQEAGNVEQIGDLRQGPSFATKGSVCAFLRTEGVETFVIMLTNENGEYGFEDINSPDTAQWEKLAPLP
ncbi:MAG: hypothetical protein GX442_04035 [Candidatus Riflebacteria bacterium]|nr:hypothetical protein [Candidatus Riflebacteria bacterium]